MTLNVGTLTPIDLSEITNKKPKLYTMTLKNEDGLNELIDVYDIEVRLSENLVIINRFIELVIEDEDILNKLLQVATIKEEFTL